MSLLTRKPSNRVLCVIMAAQVAYLALVILARSATQAF
jgi:hypothetical protein